MSYTKKARVSGILLHPTSLPTSYGIGDLGQAAYEFIDFLKASGQHLWQTLPLTPTGFGDSPYQGFSAFAGQPLLVSPECLMKMGLLEEWELTDCPRGQEDTVDYGTIIPWKTKILRLAASRFKEKADKALLEEYEDFLKDNMDWLGDYALFMSCKDMHEGREWLSWDLHGRSESNRGRHHRGHHGRSAGESDFQAQGQSIKRDGKAVSFSIYPCTWNLLLTSRRGDS